MVLHDGVDAGAFAELPASPSLRERLALPLDKKVVVYSGSLYEDRGLDRVLDLARAFPEVYFVLIGGPEDRARYYRSLASRENIGNLSVIGYVPHAQVREYLAAKAHVTCGAFTSEGDFLELSEFDM